MKSFGQALVALSLVAAFGAAHAASRAEVLADLHVYRESGLYLLDVSEISPLSADYKTATQRYSELRTSPRFAQLVQKYEGHGAEHTAQLAR